MEMLNKDQINNLCDSFLAYVDHSRSFKLLNV